MWLSSEIEVVLIFPVLYDADHKSGTLDYPERFNLIDTIKDGTILTMLILTLLIVSRKSLNPV